MDPSSFTKTSFCGSHIDNITKNESKNFILNQLSLLCSGIKYDSRYAKVFNDQFSKNLNNPHIFFLKSGGSPYLLFLTQINSVNYGFFIDKKIKEGYEYPKIFILPYEFSSELYKGTLFECELIRKHDKKWCIGINDIYYHRGENMKKTIIIDRINIIHKLLENDFQKDKFTDVCYLFVKKYFDYKDVGFALNEFAPSLDYDIRGLYFIPLRVDYSNILYIFSKELDQGNHKTNNKKPALKPTSNKSTSNKSSPNKPVLPNNKSSRCFRIMKTMKPDVYELYLSKNDSLMKQGIAMIQTTILSHSVLSWFHGKEYDTEILVDCRYNDYFKKWEPLSLSDGPIDEL
tara:strand:+ start:611 stop:1645 length:1035 start_codon:yes stop_codon:yes gene_type:complete